MSQGSEQIRVLHVDDNREFGDMTATFLERTDDRLVVETAAGASEALERLSADVECIVSDYDMPEMNGIDLLEAVRERRPGLPFILFTGKGSEEIASEAISVGVSDYLQKEHGTDQYAVLANRITNLVKQRRAERRVERYDQQLEQSERYRQELLDVTADRDLSIEQKIERLLRLGCDRFGLENGHLVKIDETCGRHEVITVAGSDVVQRGVTDLSETYCRRTIESDNILDVHDAIRQGWEDDPAFQRFGLSCYLGGVIRIEDKLLGTLCFVDTEPRAEPFTPDEKAFFDLLSRWIAQLLEYKQHRVQSDAIFQHAQDAIFLVDVIDGTEFRVRRVNRAYEELTGWTNAELTGKQPREIAGEKTGAEIEQRYQTCVDRAEPMEYAETLAIDGEPRQWETRIAPVLEDDEVIQLVGATRDVTEQRERERELRREQAFTEQALNTLEDVFYVVGTDGTLRRWNDRLLEVTDHSDEAIDEIAATELFPPEERERIADAIDQTLETGQTSVESAFRTAEGETIPYEFTGTRLTDPDGDLVGLVGVGRDISERKHRERKLREERNRFRAVFERAFDAMVITDDSGQYVDVNDSATELFGLPERELLGRSIVEFAPEEFDFEAAWQQFQESDAERGTFPLVRPDGEQRLVEYAATADIVPGRHLSVLRDVTEREQRKETLERQNERLEQFASLVSHDLRNPLSVAGGRLELAREECDSEHLEHVSQSLDRMETLIDDLLALAQEGNSVGDQQPVDLAELSERCWDTIQTADARLIVEADRSIRADRSRLQQLLENLFRNAVDHGGEGVTVTVGHLPDGFFVADDGVGIAADDREAAFESSYTTGGTGLGLTIVEEIARAHGWTVRIADNDGGARFEITGVEFTDE